MPPSQHHLLMGAVSGARLEKLPEVSTLFREQYANTGGSPPPLQPTLALRGPKAPPGQLQPRKAYLEESQVVLAHHAMKMSEVHLRFLNGEQILQTNLL